MGKEIYGSVLNEIAKDKGIAGKELALRLGVSEATVSRALRALKENGLLVENKQGELSLSEKPTVALADAEEKGMRLCVFSFDGKLLREMFIPFPEEMSKEDGMRSAMGDVAIATAERLGVIAPRWSFSQWRAVGAEVALDDRELLAMYNSLCGGVDVCIRSDKGGFAVDVLFDGKQINPLSEKRFSRDEIAEAVELVIDCLAPKNIMLFLGGEDGVRKNIADLAEKRNVLAVDFCDCGRRAVMNILLEAFRYRIAADALKNSK